MDEIPEFLDQITRGRPVPPGVIEEVKHRYGLIGRSPLTTLTRQQGELLSEELKLPVYVGMRNWKPFIADAIATMKSDGVGRAVKCAVLNRLHGSHPDRSLPLVLNRPHGSHSDRSLPLVLNRPPARKNPLTRSTILRRNRAQQ